MRIWKAVVMVTATLLLAGQASAQADEKSQRELQEREQEYAERLREAEEQMEQAARRIAELTTERLPQITQIERRFEISNTPRIGVTIDGSAKAGPVEGVEIDGVTPGSAADDAGLRAGDIITAVNDESLSAGSSKEANKRLLNFMEGVEESDLLALEYLRNGNMGSVEVSPRIMEMHAFSWSPGGQKMQLPSAPMVIERFGLDRGFPWAGSSWGSMELVELNAGLGKYFGTDSGLLVVSAPKSDGMELLDGDVIQSIDGRVPKDVRHAMRILSSYQSGETLKLSIMRDKRKHTLDIEIPADQRSSLVEPAPPLPLQPARAPAPPLPPAPEVST